MGTRLKTIRYPAVGEGSRRIFPQYSRASIGVAAAVVRNCTLGAPARRRPRLDPIEGSLLPARARDELYRAVFRGHGAECTRGEILGLLPARPVLHQRHRGADRVHIDHGEVLRDGRDALPRLAGELHLQLEVGIAQGVERGARIVEARG